MDANMEQFGPYRVHEPLGTGGMATVHRAELVAPTGEHKVIALKRLLPEVAAHRALVRRFVDEARLGIRLRHANIVKTYAVGEIERVHFIALEYVRGCSLLQLIRHCPRGAIPVPVALHVLTQTARALAYSHTVRDDYGQPLGIVHRDVAPSNIMIADTGATKLIDFGVAKAATAQVQTQGRAVIGKLGYIAPEYFLGRFDARVDLFSLGVVGHELLTGRRLFEGANEIQAAERVRSQPIEPPSRVNTAVPADLCDIIMTALQRDPALRWQNALAMYTALENVAHESGLAWRDADVAAWLESLFPSAPAVAPADVATEIHQAVDLAFALARTRTNPTLRPAAH